MPSMMWDSGVGGFIQDLKYRPCLKYISRAQQTYTLNPKLKRASQTVYTRRERSRGGTHRELCRIHGEVKVKLHRTTRAAGSLTMSPTFRRSLYIITLFLSPSNAKLAQSSFP